MITDNKIYKAVIDYANANGLKYAYTDSNMEIDPSFDFNGFDFIDTETFEIPCCFEVEDAVIVCLMTPNEMTPEDTGESYDHYYNILTGLNKIAKPQYIAPDGCYVKMMCWCNHADSGKVGEDDGTTFKEACTEAIKKAVNEKWFSPIESILDFRFWEDENDPTPVIVSINPVDIEAMWEAIKDRETFDCEIYVNTVNENHSFPSDHGVRKENGNIKVY
jgi:hypothetical protein